MDATMIRIGWLAAGGAFACAPEELQREIPPITWVGEHLEYAPQEGAYELCAGTLPYMDRYVELVAEATGVEIEHPLIYVHGSEEAETLCDDETKLGCAFPGGLYARVAPQEHELVHGVRAAYGFSHPFFEEGTAEAFGDDARMPMRVPAHGDLLEGIESATWGRGLPIEWYPRAGHFVAYIHEQYGFEVTMALLEETDRQSSAAQSIAVVEETTGVPFEKLRQSYDLEPTCSQSQYRYPLYACEEPALLQARCDGTEAVNIPVTVACDDPGTLGPRDGEIWTYLAFEVETDGEYLIFSYSPVNASFQRLELKECALGCDSVLVEQGVGILLDQGPVFLHAGRYSMKIVRPEGEPGEVSVAVLGGGCW